MLKAKISISFAEFKELIQRKQRKLPHSNRRLMRGIKISLLNHRVLQFLCFLYIKLVLQLPGLHKLTVYIVNSFSIGRKQRKLFSSDYLDFIYSKSLSLLLDKYLEPLYSDSLYSFRKGRSSLKLLNDLRERVLKSGRQQVFILKADISSYGENIRHDVLERLLPKFFWKHVKKIIQNECIDWNSGRSFCNYIGLPTGSPVVPPLENLYLLSFDEKMHSFSPIFYGRFGDDFIVVTSNFKELELIQKSISDYLIQIGLNIHPEKIQAFEFHFGPDSQDCFEHLGILFHGKGYFSLPDTKFKSLCIIIKREINRLGHLCRHLEIPQEDRMKMICDSLSKSLSNHHLGGVNWKYWMQIIDHDDQLKVLDQYQRQHLLKAVFGKISAKGFRKIERSFFHKSHYSFQHAAHLLGDRL